MSLMKLLTAGKSWVSGKDDAVRYRAVDPRALPKFGSGKNAFRSTTRAGETEQSVGARTAPVRRSQESKTTSALLPDRCQSSGARAGTVRAPDEPVVSGLGTWWKKLAALVPKSQRLAGGKSVKKAEKGAIGHPTQPELSLEKVQVIANDLSDADLEVVQRVKEKSAPKKSAARQLRASDLQKQSGEKDLESANQVTVGRG